MNAEHGDILKGPPVYRKHFLGENVSDEELAAFYEKYPYLKPLPSDNV